MDNDLPIRYVTLDPPRRGETVRTLSHYCEKCKCRHTYGATGASQPGDRIERASHCDSSFGCDVRLIIGEEEHIEPAKIRRTRQPRGTLAADRERRSA